MVQDDSEHKAIVAAARKALTAKESPITQKRFLELIEEAKARFRATAQADSVKQGTDPKSRARL